MSNIVSLEKVRGEIFEISTDELIGSIISKDDFVVINDKIEPKRDLALKLFTATRIESYHVELQQVVSSEKETVYVCKATVSRKGKVAEGLGACSTKEIENRGGSGGRIHHDALATAETRAYKRAIEAVVGLPFINEIILKLFGSYDAVKGVEADTPSITPDEFVRKIKEAKALPHLKNIWTKYQGNLKTYTAEDRERVVSAKNQRKEELHSEQHRGNH